MARWPRRLQRGTPEATPPPLAPSVAVADPEVPSFEGTCFVCGAAGTFELHVRSLREGFECPSCRASLRYQGQAAILVDRFGPPGTASVRDLVQDDRFRGLRIYEPGVIGPFRRYLAPLPGYQQSGYWPDVEPGQSRGGVRCEDLMALTFEDRSFDLVVSSDIFEHVRHPDQGFAEVHRVLRPGGLHVFSVPAQRPLQKVTTVRVDVSGPQDVMIEEPRYHHGPGDTQELVYNDFGRDLIDRLAPIGFDTEIVAFDAPEERASRLLTFVAQRRPD